MSLEVIGAGYGRTGTMSLKAALEELGFSPCYHMTEVFANPDHIGFWERTTSGKPVEWEEVFRRYRAAVDWPAAAFYEELMKKYPNAKVILTVREPDRWYESALNTIYNVRKVASSPLLFAGSLFVPRMRNMRRAGLMAADLIWDRTFDGRFEDREYAIETFERSNEEVKNRVPSEKLLVYEVRDGWGPLCKFLGVEEPRDKPFPHLNDGEEFRRMIRRLRAASSATLIGGAALISLALLYLATRGRASRRRW